MQVKITEFNSIFICVKNKTHERERGEKFLSLTIVTILTKRSLMGPVINGTNSATATRGLSKIASVAAVSWHLKTNLIA